MLFSGKTVYIINKKSGTVLDLSSSDQTSVIGWDRHGGDNQKVSSTVARSVNYAFSNLNSLQWTLTASDNGGWAIENIDFKKYLNIAEAPRNGVHLIGGPFKRHWEIRSDERDPKGWR